jgi:hypothetical protein
MFQFRSVSSITTVMLAITGIMTSPTFAKNAPAGCTCSLGITDVWGTNNSNGQQFNGDLSGSCFSPKTGQSYQLPDEGVVAFPPDGTISDLREAAIAICGLDSFVKSNNCACPQPTSIPCHYQNGGAC